MKKNLFILLLTSIFTLTSCSSDDDAGPEHIVSGTWALVEVQPEGFYNPNACPENPTVTFNADNTTDSVFYDAENNCEAENSKGTWQDKGNNVYVVTIPNFGTSEGKVEFLTADKFSFSTSIQTIPVTLFFERR